MVLAHFQAGSGHAARVGCFARRIQDFGFQEGFHRFQCGRHIRAFGHADDAVGQQGGRVFAVQFVLGGARQGDVAFYAPRFLVFKILQALLFGIYGDAFAAHFLQLD